MKQENKRPYLPHRDRRLMYWASISTAILTASIIVITHPSPSLFAYICALAFLSSVLNLTFFRIPIFTYDRILSAVSPDGILWTKETGIRIDVGINDSQVYYPQVVSNDDGYRMYYRAGHTPVKIGSAHSKDGMQWTLEPEIRVGPEAGHALERIESSSIIKLPNLSYRMYFGGVKRGAWRIYTSSSDNGLQWNAETVSIDQTAESHLNQAKDPSVINENGHFRIFFTCFSADKRFSKNDSQIFTALSDDGLTWGIAIPCSGYSDAICSSPMVVKLDSGLLRMYFTEFPDNTPIGARIVSATSVDGIGWTRELGVRISPDGEPDKHGVFCPHLVEIDDGWRMYYGGYWGTHLLEYLTLRSYRH